MKKYLSIIAIAALFAACDKVDGPYSENPTGNGNDTGAVRKILIEDFTGAKCGNCPRAAEAIDQLKGIYGDRIVSYGVHAGFFAEPNSPGSSKFTTDFRTDIGNTLDAEFGNSAAGLPNGLVNRKEVSGSYILTYPSWGATVSQIINAEPDAKLRITNTYNNSTRQVITTVNTDILNDLGGNYKLCVFVTEDSIVTWQKDYSLNPNDISSYTHRHVLRGSMNTAWGTAVGTGALTAGDSFTESFSMTLDAAWVPKHCSVVAYIYNTATKEVVQVEEAHITQ